MLSDESLVEWASGWVPDEPPGQRARFVQALRNELQDRAHPPIRHCPPGMEEESRRLHREYNALVAAQRAGATNGPEVLRLTDECAAKGIILVPGGENL
jgi:hypothetical protein